MGQRPVRHSSIFRRPRRSRVYPRTRWARWLERADSLGLGLLGRDRALSQHPDRRHLEPRRVPHVRLRQSLLVPAGTPAIRDVRDGEAVAGNECSTRSRFARSQWYHLAATFKRPVLKTYVNGQAVGSANWDYPIGHRGDLLVGKWSGAGHKGLIDEVKIFNRALSAAEIKAEYQQAFAGGGDVPQGQPAYELIPRTSQLAAAAALFENDSAKLAVSPRGRCVALIDKSTGEDRILRTTPLVSIRLGDRVYRRTTCTLEDGKLIFRFDQADTTVVVGVTVKEQYFVFQVESVSNPQVDEVTFVDLSLKPCERVSGMSGLAADDRFGVCLRTLNLTTRVEVGGRPPVLKATAFKELRAGDRPGGTGGLPDAADDARLAATGTRRERCSVLRVGRPVCVGRRGQSRLLRVCQSVGEGRRCVDRLGATRRHPDGTHVGLGAEPWSLRAGQESCSRTDWTV